MKKLMDTLRMEVVLKTSVLTDARVMERKKTEEKRRTGKKEKKEERQKFLLIGVEKNLLTVLYF